LSEIELCEELEHNFEKCLKCRNGFLPTSDGFRCLAVIEDCEEYQKSTKVENRLKC